MNPDFNETQHQKPHNKLKNAQIPLMENKLSLELKLGGGFASSPMAALKYLMSLNALVMKSFRVTVTGWLTKPVRVRAERPVLSLRTLKKPML